MAFVPELDDPNKKDESPDASDLSTQTASVPSAAPATGGQAVGGNPASSSSKSSGNFQDFSKFKAANQNKLSALSNLATDQAQGSVNKAKSAFDNAGSAFQTEIQKNAKNFDTSAYKDMNVDSKVDADAFGKDLSEANQKQDAGSYQGKLAGTEAFTGLQSAENQVGKLGTRAGTAGVLGQYGADTGNYSGAAANQDALLLQSMGDYRQKANQIAQTTKGTTEAALKANQAKIGDTAAKVDTQNQDYRTKALDSLGKLQGGIKTDLETRGAAAQQTATQQANTAQDTAVNKHLQDQLGALRGQYAADPLAKNMTGSLDKITAAEQALANGDRTLAMQIAGMNEGDVAGYKQTALGNSGVQGIGASSVLGADKGRQDQLAALERLLGTNIGISASEGPQVNAVDELVRSLGSKSKAVSDDIRQNAAVRNDQAVADYYGSLPPALQPTPQPSSASVGNKKQNAKLSSNAPGIR